MTVHRREWRGETAIRTPGFRPFYYVVPSILRNLKTNEVITRKTSIGLAATALANEVQLVKLIADVIATAFYLICIPTREYITHSNRSTQTE